MSACALCISACVCVFVFVRVEGGHGCSCVCELSAPLRDPSLSFECCTVIHRRMVFMPRSINRDHSQFVRTVRDFGAQCR